MVVYFSCVATTLDAVTIASFPVVTAFNKKGFMEIWKPIKSFEGLYEVSNFGRVKSFRRGTVKILRPGTMNKFGHVSVALGRDNSKCVHALVMGAFVGPRPAGYDVGHVNGVGSDNRLENLKYCTRSENNRDMVHHGKLHFSVTDIMDVRALKGKESGKKVGTWYKVSMNTIYAIWNRKIYAHI